MIRPPAAYAAHQAFIAPARAHPALWRLVVGLLLGGVGYVVLSQIYVTLLLSILPPETALSFAEDLQAGSTPAGMFALLFSFGLMLVVVGCVVVVLHHRSPLTLLGPLGDFAVQMRLVVVAVVVLNVALWVLPPWGMDPPMQPQLPLGRWLTLLPLSLLAILVQVSAEELLFRGYLQQQLAARFASPLVWMVVPSALFALGHYSPETSGDNAIWFVLWAGIFGLLMADLTARAGTLGPAIAVHFVNNAIAMLFTAMPDNLSGLALYVLPFGMSDPTAVAQWLPVDFAIMLTSWLAVRLALRR
ncbi:CPBP family intramembrane glutamic endopeptidase [Pseudosulfitobacter pseudonitzschiae]|uniref:CPBP family intramembrane glutamic endopeptidase n=1 Tax=Pseudosulfitobacter pseudonitzschiae TaxID=1402135 RepID=UPI001AF94001|nr:CPBP family intramembrane glutamic endopeptidase [Pseudosulfitobacter pseudonitzschiae]MBM1815757.1 CPBP family intramembrane metalloprotease [Pseudosulfitobacter pseudonitzschiae]MBM1832748.1 CPBP family intramembrane metalloprotease [Pseudosulfitobacter pseudonitzschiae]MBM1837616.1 CPBP family intramembrane metalloprotease [Pseudosulfitobacter pseudonitzschiae]MBM1842462.1 CPBP family intramembrane metalloprotease [Pseudosulfitobacter pseudonitzschiae]MBM1847330.1 CPBP family intramembra